MMHACVTMHICRHTRASRWAQNHYMRTLSSTNALSHARIHLCTYACKVCSNAQRSMCTSRKGRTVPLWHVTVGLTSKWAVACGRAQVCKRNSSHPVLKLTHTMYHKMHTHMHARAHEQAHNCALCSSLDLTETHWEPRVQLAHSCACASSNNIQRALNEFACARYLTLTGRSN